MRGRLIKSSEKASDMRILVENGDARGRDLVVSGIDGFLRKIRDNEDVDIFVYREESPGSVTINIGIGKHDEKQAILDGLASLVRKSVKKLETEVKIEDKMNNEKMAFEIISAARDVLDVDI